MKEIIKTALRRTDYRVVHKATLEAYDSGLQALIGLYHLRTSSSTLTAPDPSLDCVIFSKDRALQLHALFSSYFENVKDPAPLHVLWKSSRREHRRAYHALFDMFGSRIQTVREEASFRKDLLEMLERSKSSKVMFLVDDLLFIHPVDLAPFAALPSDCFVPSLRLGRQLSYSYWYQKPMPLPAFIPGVLEDPDQLCWIWEQGEMEWGFPLSLDAHIFSRQEIMIMFKHFEFSGPNSLERIMQRFRGIYQKRYGVCPSRSVIVNIPCNRVQAEYDFRHGSIHQDLLLEKWEQGLQMDFRKLYRLNNESVHEEAPIEFIQRETSVGQHLLGFDLLA
jgi:hypothetical protein